MCFKRVTVLKSGTATSLEKELNERAEEREQEGKRVRGRGPDLSFNLGVAPRRRWDSEAGAIRTPGANDGLGKRMASPKMGFSTNIILTRFLVVPGVDVYSAAGGA